MMRLDNEIIIDRSTQAPDGYGGVIDVPATPEVVPATVSIRNNELKAQPSGLGFYTSITVVVAKGKLEVGNKIKYNDTTYQIVRQVEYRHSFVEVFVGYEI